MSLIKRQNKSNPLGKYVLYSLALLIIMAGFIVMFVRAFGYAEARVCARATPEYYHQLHCEEVR